MNLYLTSSDGENEDYEAEVTACVLSNDSINILFQTVDDSESVQGRVSLQPINEHQTTTGYWIYNDTKKVIARFSESQIESRESQFEAQVSGTLKNFRGKSVIFEGTWIDEDGEFIIDIEANIS